MKKYLPTALAAVTGAALAVAPQAQGVISHHPAIDSILAAVTVIIAHWTPSPAQK